MKSKQIKERKIFPSVVPILLLSIIIAFFVFSDLKIYKKRRELKRQIEELNKEIQLLEKRNTELKAGISKTKKEDYWEGRIREQGYVKEGEEAVIVLPPKEEEIKESESENVWNPVVWFEWLKEKWRKH